MYLAHLENAIAVSNVQIAGSNVKSKIIMNKTRVLVMYKLIQQLLNGELLK
jgi:hypothetical protein